MNNSLSTSYAQLASAFIAAFLCSSCATAQVDATEAVYKKALDFTVEIKTSTLTPFSGDSAGTSRGAGFVIDKSRGWVLTNAHVVSRSPSRVEVSVRNGDFVLANKLYVDPYLDLALLEVGAWYPAWGDMHLGPDNALQALRLLGNPPLLPVHWSTFALAMHDWDQPAERLLELAPHAGAPLVMPRLGEAVQPAHTERVQPWWRQGAAPEPAQPPIAEPAPPLAPEQVARLDWPGD